MSALRQDNAVERFADFVLAAEFESLPPATIEAAKVFFLDTLAVGIAGSSVASAGEVLRTTLQWGEGQAATVLGSGKKLPGASAAFANSFQIHCQEFDCLHEGATVHAMAVLCGSLLAAAQEHHYSGKQIILGVALGVEVAASLGLAATCGLRFFRPATAGALGATAALARLAQFDRSRFKDAWGLAYSQLAGTMQAHVEGSVALPIQVAVAARSAINSIQLVGQGLSGPHDILEGPFGYFELFEPGGDVQPVIASLGNPWRVTELSHKPFPTGRAAHGTLDALQQLRANRALALDAISAINVYVPPLVKRLVARPVKQGMSVNYARLCLQYLVPVFLKTGTIDTCSFSSELLNDPEILAAGQKVSVMEDSNPDPNALSPQRLEVLFRDGDRLEHLVAHTLGSPINPLSSQRRREKFNHCLEAGGIPAGQSDELFNLLGNLEGVADVAELMALSCRPEGVVWPA